MMSIRTAAAAATLLLAVSAAHSQPATVDWSKAQTIEVDLSNFAFSPSTLQLQHGVPYRLHFVNNSKSGHNFDSVDFFAEATVAPGDAAKVDEGKVEVAKDETVDVSLVANTAATYKVDCTHFLHSMMGMTGQVVVH